MKKLLYLFLALLLPGLIFVYLKFGAKNEFAIPVYYEKIVTSPDGCNLRYETPYRLPDSLYKLPDSDPRFLTKAFIVVFSDKGFDVSKFKRTLAEEFEQDPVSFKEAKDVIQDSVAFAFCRKCVFLIKSPYETVLFDDQGRIRGYYAPTTLEETDRLRVELKILLEKY